MNTCAVPGCGEAAWTEWRGHDLCKDCADAANVWGRAATTAEDTAGVLSRIGSNLKTHGTRSGPERPQR